MSSAEEGAPGTAPRSGSPSPPARDNEDVEEIRLAPPDPDEEHIRQRIAEGLRSEMESSPIFRPVPIKDDPERFRFTLRDLLILITAASVVLVGFRLFRNDIYTGIVGLMVLVTQILLALFKPHGSLLYLAWWILLVLYIVAIMAQAIGR